MIRVPQHDYKDKEGILQKGAHSLVYPTTKVEDKEFTHKSDEWYYCEKSLWKRYVAGEALSFNIIKDDKVVGLKNVLI